MRARVVALLAAVVLAALTSAQVTRERAAALWASGVLETGEVDELVEGNAPPDGNFTITYNDSVAITFAATATDADGTIDSLNWYFGDGSSDRGDGDNDTATHVFVGRDGAYSVSLRIRDDDGVTTVVQKGVNISKFGQSDPLNRPEQWWLQWGNAPNTTRHTAAWGDTVATEFELVHFGQPARVQDEDSDGYDAVLDSVRRQGARVMAYVPIGTYVPSWTDTGSEWEQDLHAYYSTRPGYAWTEAGTDSVLRRNDTNYAVWINPTSGTGFGQFFDSVISDSTKAILERELFNLDENIDGLFLDYFNNKPALDYSPGAEGVDLDNDGVEFDVDSNESIAWKLMFAAYLADMRELAGPDAPIVLNGNGAYNPANVTIADDANGLAYENWPKSAFGNAWDHHAAMDTLHQSYQYATPLHGRRWNLLINTKADPLAAYSPVDVDFDELVRTYDVISLLYDMAWSIKADVLGGSAVEHSSVDSLATIAGDPEGDPYKRFVRQASPQGSNADSSYVWYERFYEGGAARMMVNIESGWAYPDSVFFDEDFPYAVADFTFTEVAAGADSLTYDFASTAYGAPNSPDNLVFVLGDAGNTEYTTETFRHTFAAGDSIQVLQQVITNYAGLTRSPVSDAVTKWVPLGAPTPSNEAPTAAFDYSSTDSLTYTFDASGSSDPDGTVVSYYIQYGDDGFESSAGFDFEHEYDPTGGEKTVTLIVFDNDGASDTTSTAVPIAEPVVSGSDPTITSTSGTLTQGQTVTVSGSNFGTKSTGETMLWEDFETGDFGTYASSIRQAGYYANSEVTGTLPFAQRHARSSYAYLTTLTTAGVAQSTIVADGAESGDKWYFSYWFKADSNTVSWNPSGSSPWNIKYGKWHHDGNESITWSTSFALSATGDGLGGTVYDTDGATLNPERYYSEPQPSAGTWYQLRGWFSVGQSNPMVLWVNGNKRKDNDSAIRSPGTTAEPFIIGLQFATDPTGSGTGEKFVQDDIYWDNSWARVVLGDADTFDGCTFQEPQYVDTWSATSISITFNQGAFNSAATAYLYVVDESGNRSAGYEVTID